MQSNINRTLMKLTNNNIKEEEENTDDSEKSNFSY